MVQVTAVVPALDAEGGYDPDEADVYTGDEVPFGRFTLEDNEVQMGGPHRVGPHHAWAPRVIFHLGNAREFELSGNTVTYPNQIQRNADFCINNSTDVNVSSSNSCGAWRALPRGVHYSWQV